VVRPACCSRACSTASEMAPRVHGGGCRDERLIRPGAYKAHHEIVPVRKTALPAITVDVVGPVCETAISWRAPPDGGCHARRFPGHMHRRAYVRAFVELQFPARAPEVLVEGADGASFASGSVTRISARGNGVEANRLIWKRSTPPSMTDTQLYLAIGIPIFSNAILFGLLMAYITQNSKRQPTLRSINQRFEASTNARRHARSVAQRAHVSRSSGRRLRHIEEAR